MALRALVEISLEPDYLVFVDHDNPDLNSPAPQLQEYLQCYQPLERAHFRFSW
jgi:hypothetical protein